VNAVVLVKGTNMEKDIFCVVSVSTNYISKCPTWSLPLVIRVVLLSLSVSVSPLDTPNEAHSQ